MTTTCRPITTPDGVALAYCGEHAQSLMRCIEGLERDARGVGRLLKVCEEIAHDPRVDLVDSERRIRLYHAITLAGGQL